MIRVDSFINSINEYAYDWELEHTHDMLLREVTCDCIIINTQYGQIVVTKDTKIMMDNGMYIYANLLHVGDCLKHYTMNKSVVTGIATGYRYPMYKVVDCKDGYLIVNNFFVASDC